MHKLKDKIILELLQDETNVETYLLDLSHAENELKTKEQLFNYLHTSQEEIKDEAFKIIICTLLDPKYDRTKQYNNEEFESFFFKYFSDSYLNLENIILDYFYLKYKSMLEYTILHK